MRVSDGYAAVASAVEVSSSSASMPREQSSVPIASIDSAQSVTLAPCRVTGCEVPEGWNTLFAWIVPDFPSSDPMVAVCV